MDSRHPSALPEGLFRGITDGQSHSYTQSSPSFPSAIPRSGQGGCSSSITALSILNPEFRIESLYKAITSRALWVPRNSGGGYGASWEFTLPKGNPWVIFKAAGTGGMARGDSHSFYLGSKTAWGLRVGLRQPAKAASSQAPDWKTSWS